MNTPANIQTASEPAVAWTGLLGVLSSREKTVRQLRQEGIPFKEIALRIGSTEGNAQQIDRMARWRLARAKEWDAGLTVRAANVLNNCGIRSKAQALSAIKEGRLKPRRGPRNYGWKSHAIVCKWIGIPEPRKAKPNVWS
jgi:hypothetical protein